MAFFISALSDNQPQLHIRQKLETAYGDYWDNVGGAFVSSEPTKMTLTVDPDNPKLWTIALGLLGTYTGNVELFYFVSGQSQGPPQVVSLTNGEPTSQVELAQTNIQTYDKNKAGQYAYVYVRTNQGHPYTGAVDTTTISLDGAAAVAATNDAVTTTAAGVYRVELEQSETNADEAVVTVTGTASESGSQVLDFVVPPALSAPPRPPVERFSNTASQQVMVFVENGTGTNLPYTGAITRSEVSVDNGALTALTNAPVEVGDGWYRVTFTQAETVGSYLEVELEGATATDLGKLVIELVAPPPTVTPGSSAPASSRVVPAARRWKLNGQHSTAPEIVVMPAGADGWLEMDFSEMVDGDDGVETVDSVDDDQGTLTINANEKLARVDRRAVHFRATGYSANVEHAITVVATTVEGFKVSGIGRIVVEA